MAGPAGWRRVPLLDAIREGCLDGGAGVQRPQHGQRGDGGEGEFGSDGLGDGGEPQDADIKHLPRVPRRFEVFSAEVAEAKIHALARHGLPDPAGMPFDLIADRGSYEVGAVGVEPLLHQQIDMAEVDIAEIDRDLLAVRRLRPDFSYVTSHLNPIPASSHWMVGSACPNPFQAESTPSGRKCSHPRPG